MVNVTITGGTAIADFLNKLGATSGKKVVTAALRAGLSLFAREMRKAAPVGPTGQLKRSIGSRVVKSGSAITSAKVGINVGKRTKQKGKYAPHAHLVALGTKMRVRKRIGGFIGKFYFGVNQTTGEQDASQRQLRTGAMPVNPFIRQTFESSLAGAMTAMQKRAEKTLARELKKK